MFKKSKILWIDTSKVEFDDASEDFNDELKMPVEDAQSSSHEQEIDFSDNSENEHETRSSFVDDTSNHE